MQHKAARSFQLTKCPFLFSFSPFSRSFAQVASAKRIKRSMNDGHSVRRKPHLHSTGSGSCKSASVEKSEKSGSSHDDMSEMGEKFGSSDVDVSEMSEEFRSPDREVSERVVQADFAFFDPKPNDFHGVKILLLSYLDDKQWDLSGFVDLILQQTTVGTVVKIEDDEDDGIFSVATALNLKRYKDNKCVGEIKEYLLKACCNNKIKKDLRLQLKEETQGVGLLVSQRVTNLPPQLLPPLYDALFDEISWATEDEPTEELKNSFRFKFFIMVSKIYKLKNENKKKRKNGPSADEEGIIYIKPEDEIFHKLSTWFFTFPLHKQPPASHGLRNYKLMGVAMGVKAEQVSKFRHELRSLINES